MRQFAEIIDIAGREILDSRGNPTVAAEVTVEYRGREFTGTAAVPSGASTGAAEAHERRDGDMTRYRGKGVLQAAEAVSGEIAGLLRGKNAFCQRECDLALVAADGTPDRSRLGANALLAVSLATARAAADALGLPLYRYIGGAAANILPVPMSNLLNGGAHAANNVDIQEFMVVPAGMRNFAEAVRACSEIFHSLREVLAKRGTPAAGVGDEGGYAPNLENDEDALDALSEAVRKAGYEPGDDVFFALDAAASEWYSSESRMYILPSRKIAMTSSDLVEYWENLVSRYPIISIEDGCAEEDWDGWKALTRALGSKCQLVGDDLFVTNVERLAKGISLGTANAILLKPNQIGTLSETIDAARLAAAHGFGAIMSHRSGEPGDTCIADLAVALGTGQIKTGAPCRSERTEKYNRLMYIERELGDASVFARHQARSD